MTTTSVAKEAILHVITTVEDSYTFQTIGKRIKRRIINGARIMLQSEIQSDFPWWRSVQYEAYSWLCARMNCRPGDVAIDVGANVGIITYLLSCLVGSSGLVYAIEPDPSNYSILLETLRFNHCGNVLLSSLPRVNETATSISSVRQPNIARCQPS